MANDIEIRKIFVNKIPEGCGECPMMQYIDESPVCVALPPERNAARNPLTLAMGSRAAYRSTFS